MLREKFFKLVTDGFKAHPVVGIIGPRESGKTTLARHFAREHNHLPRENYFDLEDIADLERLASPKTALSMLKGLIVIDEIQRRPELFQTLRVLVDEDDNDRQFLILGSASQELLQQSSESLAGRIFYIE